MLWEYATDTVFIFLMLIGSLAMILFIWDRGRARQ
ncbi:EYxxD motif small membrane protein [Alteribacter lacisalsi]